MTTIFIQCKGQLEIAAFRGANRHAGSDVLTVVYMPASAFPYKINGCVEVFFYPIDGPLKETTDRTGVFLEKLSPIIYFLLHQTSFSLNSIALAHVIIMFQLILIMLS